MALDGQYQIWSSSKSEDDLSTLLEGVRKLASNAYRSKCPKLAEDLSQQVVISCWRNLDKFDPNRASISTWVRLTINSVLNRELNTSYRTTETRADVDIDTLDLTDEGIEPTNYKRLRDCFAHDLDLLHLLLEGHSLVECAKVLGLSRKAVRYRLGVARRMAAKHGAQSC